MNYKGLYLHNIQEVIEQDGYHYLSRLPKALHDKNGHTKGFQMTGVEIRLIPKEPVIITIGSNQPYIQSKALISYDGHFDREEILIFEETQIVVHPVHTLRETFKENVEVRIVLTGEFIYIKDVQGEFDLFVDDRKRYLAYGTSITQGLFTNQAEGAYPYLLGRNLDFEVHNYGMSGRAYCEPQTADFLCGLGDFDLITLELTVNMFTDGFGIDVYKERVGHLIRQVHERHPNTYIFCIGIMPFYNDYGIQHPEQLNESTIDEFRMAYKTIVASINSDKVIFVEPSQLISRRNLCVDLIHPTSTGMYEIAYQLESIIKPYL